MEKVAREKGARERREDFDEEKMRREREWEEVWQQNSHKQGQIQDFELYCKHSHK